jgi:hypothetical protein
VVNSTAIKLEFQMRIQAIICSLIVLSFCPPASAQQAKELTTPKGKAIGLVNLVTLRDDCSVSAISVPKLAVEPQHGKIQMLVALLPVPARGECPARTVNAIVLGYGPAPDFSGSDDIKIEITDGNKTTEFQYRVKVE